MTIPIIVILLAALLVLWNIVTCRKLRILDRTASNAMKQISAQLSVAFRALSSLAEMTRTTATHESILLTAAIRSRRRNHRNLTPGEVLKQECVLEEVLGRVSAVAEEHPILKTPDYQRCITSVARQQRQLRASRRVYNQAVDHLNRLLGRFPGCIAGRVIGLSPKEFLAGPEEHPAPGRGKKARPKRKSLLSSQPRRWLTHMFFSLE